MPPTEALGVSSELHQLVRLQQIELQISALRKEIDDLPKALAELEAKQSANRQTIQEAESRVEQTRIHRRALESEVEGLKTKLSKFKSQLMEVKTNKEYQAMLHEISQAEKEIGVREDEILEAMLLVDDLTEQAESAKSAVAERSQELEEERTRLAALTGEAESRIETLSGEREELIQDIPGTSLAEYRRIGAAKNGLALAEARDQTCQACHVRLRPQFYADIRSGRQIMHCESCHRILYYVQVSTSEASAAETASEAGPQPVGG